MTKQKITAQEIITQAFNKCTRSACRKLTGSWFNNTINLVQENSPDKKTTVYKVYGQNFITKFLHAGRPIGTMEVTQLRNNKVHVAFGRSTGTYYPENKTYMNMIVPKDKAAARITKQLNATAERRDFRPGRLVMGFGL